MTRTQTRTDTGEPASERSGTGSRLARGNAIPTRCPVCQGRSTLLVAVPTPSCMIAYFACDNCALVKIVQH